MIFAMAHPTHAWRRRTASIHGHVTQSLRAGDHHRRGEADHGPDLGLRRTASIRTPFRSMRTATTRARELRREATSSSSFRTTRASTSTTTWRVGEWRRQGGELRHDSPGVHRQDDSGREEAAGRVQEEERRDRGRQPKIQNLNALLTQARADTKAGNYDAAIKAMQEATTPSRMRRFSGSRWATRSWAARMRRKGGEGCGNPDDRSGDHAEVYRCRSFL